MSRKQLIAIGVVLLIALALPLLVSGYRVFQFNLVLVYAIALLGLNMLTGYNGQISLGHGAFYAIGAYCAAKHALEGLSECLSLELAPHGVHVLIVEPGAFRTALFGGGFKWMPENPAYAKSVGPIRAFVAGAHDAQAGDPAKAAKAIADVVGAADREAPPLRLPLGADAVDGIRQKLANVGKDVDRTEAMARATAFAT